MKTLYVLGAFVTIIGYNMFLAQRDHQLFKAYDKACAELPQPHPDCLYAK
jgi:hypothetical protein